MNPADSPIAPDDVRHWEAQLRALDSPYSYEARALMQSIDYGRELLGLPLPDWTAYWGVDPFDFEALPREARAGRARPRVQTDHRAAVWDKTGGRCWYCGVQTNPWRDFAIDHLLARSAGGSDALANLVPACRTCNTRKGNRALPAFRRTLTALAGGPAYRFYFETLLGEEAPER